jgi:hypothetical protein
MAKYIITVGTNAQVFHDQATGITVIKGEKVTLRESQFHSRRIQQALASGHLRLVPEASQVEMVSDDEAKKLDKQIKSQYKRGTEISKLSSSTSLEVAKKLAKINNVDIEETDTVEDILKAILED